MHRLLLTICGTAPIPDKTAELVAHALATYEFLLSLTPKVILFDNGTEFRNNILAEICRQYGINQTLTGAYHRARNGLVKRTNCKILEILQHVLTQVHDA